MRSSLFIIVTAALAISLTGCALSTGFRFGDGTVSGPELHGSVNASGTAR